MLTAPAEDPKKARFTKDNVIIKDRHFYSGNDISWNKPSRITDKYYPYFHQQNDANKQKIEELKNQEVLDKEVLAQMRREQIIEKKQETQARYGQRVLERTLIQNKSNQPIKSLPDLDGLDHEEEALDVIAKRIDASKHLRSNEISWNHLHKASQKYVDQVVRPVCLKGETEMVEAFKKKIELERKAQEEKLARRDENHRAIREIFLSKHEENFSKEKKVGTVPVISSLTSLSSYNKARAREIVPSIQVLDEEEPEQESENPVVQSGPSLMTTDGEFKLKYASSLSNIGDMSVRGINMPSLNKLASPQTERKKEYTGDYSELKGMLIKNMDYQVFHKDNALYSTLATNNKVFHDTLLENREARKKISKDKSETASKLDSIDQLSMNGQLEMNTKRNSNKGYHSERDKVFDDMDDFNKRIAQAPPKLTGFNKVELEKVYKQATGKLIIEPKSQKEQF